LALIDQRTPRVRRELHPGSNGAMSRTGRLLAVAAACVAVTGIATPPVASAAGSSVTLTPRGIGHLRIGMTLTGARRASGRRIRLSGAEITPGCRYATVRSLRVFLMLIKGRIARIELGRGSPVRMLGGLRRGDTEQDVRAVYGPKVVETPHTYVPDGSYLTIGWRTGPYTNRGIRFETDEVGTITAAYAGRRGEIRLVEGCL
jgi:hypothetical protein